MSTPEDEEQIMEMETLECIFMDEFQCICNELGKRQYRFEITPNPNNEDINHVSVSFECSIPIHYPSSSDEKDHQPTFQIANLYGLADDQITDITNIVEEKIKENIGMTMIYTIVEVIREWLLENNIEDKGGSIMAQMEREKVRKLKEQEKKNLTTDVIYERDNTNNNNNPMMMNDEEEEEIDAVLGAQKKLNGLEVTVEAFNEWKRKFDIEMGYDKKVEAQHVKLSGKQMFLNKIAGTTEEELEIDEDEEILDISEIEINDTIFENEDIDLDDLDDDDDDDEA